MASIVVEDNTVVVTCGARVLTVLTDQQHLQVLEPLALMNPNPQGGNVNTQETTAYVVCAALCKQWFALCTSNKQLGLWDTSGWSIRSTRPLTRTAQKLSFTPSGRDVIVADKSGDAYLYSVEKPDDAGVLLLGHLSMLLDVVISQDERYIITCDRDEKIRVSSFPNAYNIQSYCLGHTEFVSCISLLSHSPSVLISSSGDGTLRLWDFKQGTELSVITCREHIQSYLETSEKQYNRCLDSPSDQNNEYPLAVTHVDNYAASNVTSIIGACISTFKGCILYKATGDKRNASCTFTRIVSFSAEPWCIFISNCDCLWTLTNSEEEPLSVFDLKSEVEQVSNLETQKIHNVVTLINKHHEWFKQVKAPEIAHVLYKRKFGNIQEYLDKKRARLLNAAQSSVTNINAS